MNTYIIGCVESAEDIPVDSTVLISINGHRYDACVKNESYNSEECETWLDLLVGESRRVIDDLIMAGNNITIRIDDRDIPFLVGTTEPE